MRNPGILLQPPKRVASQFEAEQAFASMGIRVDSIVRSDSLLLVSTGCRSISSLDSNSLVKTLNAKFVRLVCTPSGLDFAFCYRT